MLNYAACLLALLLDPEDGVRSSETQVNFYRLHGVMSHETVLFNYMSIKCWAFKFIVPLSSGSSVDPLSWAKR
jgi:hypothetical protein